MSWFNNLGSVYRMLDLEQKYRIRCEKRVRDLEHKLQALINVLEVHDRHGYSLAVKGKEVKYND